MITSKSNMIAYICGFIILGLLVWLVKTQIKEHYLQNDPMLITLKEVLRPITYNGKSISEGLKLYKGKKSYTINKENTYMCLYDENGGYYPLNMLLYVLLHERSHSLNTKDVGHTPEFHRIFQELLDQAEALGIYNSKISIIDNYCEHNPDED